MDPETSGGSNLPPSAAAARKNSREKNELQVRRKVLLDVIEQCREALASDSDNDDDIVCGKGVKQENDNRRGSSSPYLEPEIDEFRHMIKNQAGGPELLQKIENIAQASIHLIMSEEGSSWEIVSKDDLWEGENDGLELKDYVLVRQEDVADGMACFMTAYLLSLKETKDLSPNQLQEGFIKIPLFLEQPQQPSGLHVRQYQSSFSVLHSASTAIRNSRSSAHLLVQINAYV